MSIIEENACSQQNKGKKKLKSMEFSDINMSIIKENACSQQNKGKKKLKSVEFSGISYFKRILIDYES
jgi:hypothetical protein